MAALLRQGLLLFRLSDHVVQGLLKLGIKVEIHLHPAEGLPLIVLSVKILLLR